MFALRTFWRTLYLPTNLLPANQRHHRHQQHQPLVYLKNLHLRITCLVRACHCHQRSNRQSSVVLPVVRHHTLLHHQCRPEQRLHRHKTRSVVRHNRNKQGAQLCYRNRSLFASVGHAGQYFGFDTTVVILISSKQSLHSFVTFYLCSFPLTQFIDVGVEFMHPLSVSPTTRFHTSNHFPTVSVLQIKLHDKKIISAASHHST